MSFRKRNIGLSSGAGRDPSSPTAAQQSPAVPSAAESLPGVRPSPDDGRPTTSTGSRSLDNLLAGHAGLPLGKILLIEENGATDFAGTLLRYYAAEGVVQDHKVHVIGIGEQWGRSLPGLIGPADSIEDKVDKRKEEKMKIAWRYERLGELGTGIAGPRGELPSLRAQQRNVPVVASYYLSRQLPTARRVSRRLTGDSSHTSGRSGCGGRRRNKTGCILPCFRPHETPHSSFSFIHKLYCSYAL